MSPIPQKLQLLTNEEIAQGYAKCKQSITYYCFKYIKTLDIETRQRKPFAVFNAPGDRKEFAHTIKDFLELLEKCYQDKNITKIHIYKRRQLYITTAILAWMSWHLIFDENFKAILTTEKLIKLDNPDDENSTFARLREMLVGLPDWLHIANMVDRAGTIGNPEKRNTIIAEAGDHPGRAGQASVIWGDEFAFQPRTGIRYTSMLESCKGLIILSSTPNGKSNKFYELYKNPPEDMYMLDLPITARRTQEWIQKKAESYKGNQAGYEQEILGSWESGLEGRAFTYYTTDCHWDISFQKTKELIPQGRVYIGLDQGFSHPTVALFILHLVDTYYVFDEYAQNGLPILGDNGNAKHLIQKLAHWGLSPNDITLYADPSMFAKSRETGVTADTQYYGFGLKLHPGENAVKEGILCVNTLLSMGRLKVHALNCPVLQDGLAQARYPINKFGQAASTKYIDEDYITDACDALRYGLTDEMKKVPITPLTMQRRGNARRISLGIGNYSGNL